MRMILNNSVLKYQVNQALIQVHWGSGISGPPPLFFADNITKYRAYMFTGKDIPNSVLICQVNQARIQGPCGSGVSGSHPTHPDHDVIF